MSQGKVLLVFGTRPECLKLASVHRALKALGSCHSIVMNSGQHEAVVDRILKQLGIDCDIRKSQVAGTSLFDHVRKLRANIRSAATEIGADVLVAQGDTATAYAAAMASRDLGIPLAHIEAGLRTDHPHHPFPEEHFRRKISRIASMHFAPTKLAATNLRSEGISPSRIVRSGNTIIDLLRDELEKGKAPLPLPVEPEQRVVTLTLHRRENRGHGIREVSTALKRLVSTQRDLIAVCPMPANPMTRTQLSHHLAGHDGVFLTESLEYASFIALLRRSALVITDSGGIQEEAPHLGTPTLIVRRNTERVEEAALGSSTLIKAITAHDIYLAALRILAAPRANGMPFTESSPNGDGRAGQRIAVHLATLARAASPLEEPQSHSLYAHQSN